MRHSLALFLLLAACALSRADSVPLAPGSALLIAPPKGWTVSSHVQEDAGVVVLLNPPAWVSARAVLVVSLVNPPEAIEKAMIGEQVQNSCEQFAAASVEKVKTLHEFKLSSGYGAYCFFTDASEVAKPVTADAYKNLVIGIARLSDQDAIAVSLLFNGAAAPELAAMLEAISSARIETRAN